MASNKGNKTEKINRKERDFFHTSDYGFERASNRDQMKDSTNEEISLGCSEGAPEESLVENQLDEKPENKFYSCQICGKGFFQIHAVKTHENIHSANKPHECDLCGNRYYQSHHLKSHFISHSGKRPYECKQHKSDLKRHETVHTCEKPFIAKNVGNCF